MAVKLLGFLNQVINRTTSEILNDQLVDKMTGVVSTFLNSGVEAIRDLTAEDTEEIEEEEN